jgi:Flp pilus assembly protein TadG
MTRRVRRTERGAAALEMALLLPFFLIAAFGAVDFAMLFRRAAAVHDCAASGAAAGVALGPSATQAARDVAIRAAVVDAATVAGLAPVPEVGWAPGTDAAGFAYIEVTASHASDGSVGMLWSPGTIPIARKVRLMTSP